MASKQKLAVVLMNLGGPDSPQAIRPFLYNLFSDPAIIPWSNPFRSLLAWVISRNRSKKAEKIYGVLGGQSPLYENTQKQAKALKIALNEEFSDFEIQIFIAMRYWHPFISEAKKEVLNFNPDKVILLPLYPHFSGTTTGSSGRGTPLSGSRASRHLPAAAPCRLNGRRAVRPRQSPGRVDAARWSMRSRMSHTRSTKPGSRTSNWRNAMNR